MATEFKLKYKGFEIINDRMLGYSLYKNHVWCSSDHTVEDLKNTVDKLLTFDHLNWEVKYLDADNNIISTTILKDMSVRKAETIAIKEMPKNAVNHMINEM